MYPITMIISQNCLKGFPKSVVQSLSHVQLFCTPMDYTSPGSFVHGNSPGKTTGVGCHTLLQGIFSSQGQNPGILHRRQILYHLCQYFESRMQANLYSSFILRLNPSILLSMKSSLVLTKRLSHHVFMFLQSLEKLILTEIIHNAIIQLPCLLHQTLKFLKDKIIPLYCQPLKYYTPQQVSFITAF